MKNFILVAALVTGCVTQTDAPHDVASCGGAPEPQSFVVTTLPDGTVQMSASTYTAMRSFSDDASAWMLCVSSADNNSGSN